MPNNDVLMHGVQHILEVGHFEVTLCSAGITTRETDVNLGASPQVALPRVAIGSVGVVRHFLGPHAIHIEVIELGECSC